MVSKLKLLYHSSLKYILCFILNVLNITQLSFSSQLRIPLTQEGIHQTADTPHGPEEDLG